MLTGRCRFRSDKCYAFDQSVRGPEESKDSLLAIVKSKVGVIESCKIRDRAVHGLGVPVRRAEANLQGCVIRRMDRGGVGRGYRTGLVLAIAVDSNVVGRNKRVPVGGRVDDMHTRAGD